MLGSLEALKDLKNGATIFGKFHPKGYLVAVFSCPSDCDQAVGALKGLGWADEDVVVCDGDLILEHQAEVVHNRGFIERYCNRFTDQDAFSRTIRAVSHRDDYRLVLIYAPSPQQTEIASGVVSSRAVIVQKYDDLTVTELPCQ
jgi:hypothetical protein